MSLRWHEGLLVSLLPLSQEDSAETKPIRKAYLRVSWSNDVIAGHISVHSSVSVGLGVHQYARVRITPVASHSPQHEAKRFLLRPLSRVSSPLSIDSIASSLTRTPSLTCFSQSKLTLLYFL